MSTPYIPISELCVHYKVDVTFFSRLDEYDLIETITVEESTCIHQYQIKLLEKIIRLNQELNLNLEGIDAVLRLLDKIDTLQNEMASLKKRLRIYEE